MALGCARVCGQTQTDTHLCTAVQMGVGLCYGNCAAGQVKENPTNIKLINGKGDMSKQVRCHLFIARSEHSGD